MCKRIHRRITVLNKPENPGLYWARGDYSKSWNYIVKIKGQSPFLNYIAWHLTYPLNDLGEGNGLVGVDPSKFIFSDEIKQDFNYSTKIDIPTRKGLYWVVNKTDTNMLLAYVSGKAPYMSCFLWNIESNIKRQILDVSKLQFLEKIKFPG